MSDAQIEFDKVYVDVKFVSFSDADAASNLLVLANATQKIRVLSYVLNAANGENDISFIGGSTALTGAFEVADNTTIFASAPHGLFETAINEDLDLLMSAATLVAGHISYVLV